MTRARAAGGRSRARAGGGSAGRRRCERVVGVEVDQREVGVRADLDPALARDPEALGGAAPRSAARRAPAARSPPRPAAARAWSGRPRSRPRRRRSSPALSSGERGRVVGGDACRCRRRTAATAARARVAAHRRRALGDRAERLDVVLASGTGSAGRSRRSRRRRARAPRRPARRRGRWRRARRAARSRSSSANAIARADRLELGHDRPRGHDSRAALGPSGRAVSASFSAWTATSCPSRARSPCPRRA